MYILTLDYDKRENKLVMGIYNGKLDKLSDHHHPLMSFAM